MDLSRLLITFFLFVCTAVAEILGCYLPYLILRENKSAWLWLPTMISLALFVWLLSLHPTATGRVYAAYGGIYISVALIWLRYVDHVSLTWWDLAGGAVVLCGAAIIILQPHAFVR
ncbi:YnfA family protein [Acinetobacter puyangensis]|uniref:YnfA family protein n=1 Tax=Acinetobacter puyangensis TaxID=1096779 RepID=UPI003A4D3379